MKKSLFEQYADTRRKMLSEKNDSWHPPLLAPAERFRGVPQDWHPPLLIPNFGQLSQEAIGDFLSQLPLFFSRLFADLIGHITVLDTDLDGIPDVIRIPDASGNNIITVRIGAIQEGNEWILDYIMQNGGNRPPGSVIIRTVLSDGVSLEAIDIDGDGVIDYVWSGDYAYWISLIHNLSFEIFGLTPQMIEEVMIWNQNNEMYIYTLLFPHIFNQTPPQGWTQWFSELAALLGSNVFTVLQKMWENSRDVSRGLWRSFYYEILVNVLGSVLGGLQTGNGMIVTMDNLLYLWDNGMINFDQPISTEEYDLLMLAINYLQDVQDQNTSGPYIV